jgi:hypothetical protein
MQTPTKDAGRSSDIKPRAITVTATQATLRQRTSTDWYTSTESDRTRNKAKWSEVKLIYDRRSVGQSVLVSGSHLEPMTRFFFLYGDCGFPDMWHPLWWEDGSVIYLYNCFWSLPEQSLLIWSPAELTTIFYCLIWDSPNLEGQFPVFISPRNRVAQLYSRALGSLLSPLTTRRDAMEVF